MTESSDPEFVDSNVLVYAHDVGAGPKREAALGILDDLWARGVGCVSIQVLQEFFVTVTRKLPRRVDAGVASEVVAHLARWRVHRPGTEDVLEAIEIHKRRRISFWDALIIQSARALGCAVLWSEDLKPGRFPAGVTIRNPFA